MEVQKMQKKIQIKISNERKYMTEQGGNSDKEGTTENKNKSLPKLDLSNDKNKT